MYYCFNEFVEYNFYNLNLYGLIAAYKDLLSREATRNAVWQQEGWHEVVYYTGELDKALPSPFFFFLLSQHNELLHLSSSAVPLIQHMDSRIMIPTKASPLQ